MVTNQKYSGGKTRGFTLLELLVVLVIAGMLMALVPPVVSAVVPGTRAKVAARDLAATLRYARNLAVIRSTTIDVQFDTSKQTYVIANGKPETPPHGAAITIVGNETPYTLRFYADGSSNGITARLGAEDGGYIVSVDWLMGRVALSEAHAGAH